VLWLTGLPAAGKTTLAELLQRRLKAMGRPSTILDGDVLRRGLSRDLGFSEADRAERRKARARMPEGRFVEIFVDTPLAEAERRDPRGLYRKARRGELKNFTGVDAPYEAPENPKLRIATLSETPEAGVERILAYLASRNPS
jgi:bifunctional enzyme CysN/CysC